VSVTSPSGLGAPPSGASGAWDDVPEPNGRWSNLGPWAQVPGAGPAPEPGPDPETICARTDPAECGHPRSAHDPGCSECACEEFEEPEDEPLASPLGAMTVAELRDELAGLGLPTSGNKADLIERLEEADG